VLPTRASARLFGLFPGRQQDEVSREEDPERVATAFALEEEHEDGERDGAPDPVARMLVEVPQ
jgi:hypothetical protein